MSAVIVEVKKQNKWVVLRDGEQLGNITRTGTAVQFSTKKMQTFNPMELAMVREFMFSCASK